MYFKVETYSSSDLYIQVQSEMALICKVLNCLLHTKINYNPTIVDNYSTGHYVMVFVVWTRRARWNPGQWRVSAVWCYWPMGTSLSGQYMYIMTSPLPSKNRNIIATTWSNKATRRNNNIVIMIESHLLGGYCPCPHLLLWYMRNKYYWTCIHSQDMYHRLLFSLNYNPFSFHRNL